MQADPVELLDLIADVRFPEGDVNHRRLDIGVTHRLHDGSGNWDPLNLIFPAYFELMTRFPTVCSEDARAITH